MQKARPESMASTPATAKSRSQTSTKNPGTKSDLFSGVLDSYRVVELGRGNNHG